MLVACGALALATLRSGPAEAPVAAVNAARVVALTNEERAEEGVNQLARNALLDEAAQMKAEDMAAKGYYAHVSPDGVTPMHWVEEAGYEYLIIGENLVVNRTDAEGVVDAFMGSPGHRANILRKDFTEIGIGVARGTYKGKEAVFAVQIFAAPYPRSVSAVSKTSKAVVKPTSNIPEEPSVPKAPAAITVPRSLPIATSSPISPAAASASQPADSLSVEVKELIKPIFPGIEAHAAAPTSVGIGARETPPSFILADPVPVYLPSVSPSQQDMLPVQAGSTWSMQFRVLVDRIVSRARSWFGS